MEEITLYDKDGIAVAYIAPDEDYTIYLWNGRPIGYLHKYKYYAFDGHHLGWYSKGVIYDNEGVLLYCIENKCSNIQPIHCEKQPKRRKPIRSIRHLAEERPIFKRYNY
ncbi:MAG: hypothetical protein MJZ69_07390 [Bacteroidaceae bacterium]|nr:hypothetical protein [Bacteroidaceae bacterium]